MNILIFHNTILPVTKYGGTERVVWWLGKALHKMGHRITFLVAKGSVCDFAKVIFYNPNLSLNSQIPAEIDVVHLSDNVPEMLEKPYLITIHGNGSVDENFDINSVFISKNHAERHNSSTFVYNGVDFDDYGKPDFLMKRRHVHFLAKAAWKIKNVAGAIELSRRSRQKLVVLGGTRLNLKMGFRFTPDTHVRFYGMVGGEAKNLLLNQSHALIFPVLWHEPFGLAIIESLYFGCPVIGTPYGSLPELVPKDIGFLSNKKTELVSQLLDLVSRQAGIQHFNSKSCHEYATDNFGADKMAASYLQLYEKVLNGKKLNNLPPKLLENQPKYLPFEE
jgi:glycosyltransferase involved in cell wall biosynthesis